VTKTVIIFVLLGAILGAVTASFVAPPVLGWYNEAGFLTQSGQVQALVNLPQVIKYTSVRLLKAQAVGAGLGAFTFLVLGLSSASRSRRRREVPPAAAPRPPA
jgi:phosphoribosylcarboxyaminoimidazole (NCAIR) mutase